VSLVLILLYNVASHASTLLSFYSMRAPIPALKPIRACGLISAKSRSSSSISTLSDKPFLDQGCVPSETSNGASHTSPKSTPSLLLAPNFFQATGLMPMSATARFGLVSSSMVDKLVRSPVLGAPRETTCCAFMTRGVES